MKKKSKTKEEKLRIDWREYNKLMRRCNSQEKTWDEYVRYRQGKAPKPRFQTPSVPKTVINTKTSHRELYPSACEGGSTPKKPEQRYTGSLIKGIAVAHKSNLVPVTGQKDATDLANMRRN